MEKPCERCKTVTMTDDESRLCYDCWVELDLFTHNQMLQSEEKES